MPLDPSRDAVPAPCKGVPPLTLFRDWIERTFMLYARVYAGISLLRERPEGNENRRSLRSPSGLLRPPSKLLDFYRCSNLIRRWGDTFPFREGRFCHDTAQSAWVCTAKGSRGRAQASSVFMPPCRLRRGESPAPQKHFPAEKQFPYLAAFAKASRSPTVRLNTGSSAVESGSLQK